MAPTDSSLATLIERARDAAAPTPERHQAFAEIVRRFQDLAFGCAYARLRDPALAEDAAQDAFLLAWQRLDQLRAPAAFPGWVRRLVLTQCHRRLRGARLALRPEREARDLAMPTDPAVDAEEAEDAALVGLALGQLAAADRLVLVLFFGCDRSQAEIADWLGVPLTTVARRLAHAKRRLRRRAIEGMARGLRARCAGAGEPLLIELAAGMRGAEPADDAAVAQLRDRLGVDRARRKPVPAPACAYLVEHPGSGAPIAYAAAWPTIFEPIYDLQIAVGEEALRRHAGDVLLTQILQDLQARDAITLQHRTSARHTAVVDFLLARGFQVLARAQDWRLDATGGARLAAASRAARPDAELLDVAAISQDPTLFAGVLDLLTETLAEEPAERIFLPIHPDALRRVLRRQRAGVVAVAAGRLQGLIAAADDDSLPGALRLDIALVRRDQRRRGLASALLARLLANHAATSLRVLARAGDDLAAWLAGRGFARRSDQLLLERLLRKTVAVAPGLLDDYVGSYVVAGTPGAHIVIERHGDALISKSRDMRDLLLASSDCEFFTRHHHGRGRFERDETGRVTRLRVREGPHELVAVRT